MSATLVTKKDKFKEFIKASYQLWDESLENFLGFATHIVILI